MQSVLSTLAKNSPGGGHNPSGPGVLPSLKGSMTELVWKPELKPYPHFDAVISAEKLDAFVRNPEAVAKNAFFPLLSYKEKWQRFRSRPGGKPPKKGRPIRYAARRDANIFSYYRYILSAPYEQLLKEKCLENSVIAYRKILSADGNGKSNIEFARDAFENIQYLRNCVAITLDIKSYFESLDHALLKEKWIRLLGGSAMSPDHTAVFKAITKYAEVDRSAAYERLGYLREEIVDGEPRLVYTVRFDEMPKKLCTNAQYREKISGNGGKYKSLINVNRKPHGIPQGTPLSDLLANLYLIDFDETMKNYCEKRGGFYYRYSDDIIIILPGAESEGLMARDFATVEVMKHGRQVRIKESKTAGVVYENGPIGQTFRTIAKLHGKNGLEYLGFRYDGKKIFVRDSTISRLYRKIALAVKGECAATIKRYHGMDAAYVIDHFDYSGFFQRYGRVDDFDPEGPYKTWTFWTYARRAMKAFKASGSPIPRQLRRYKMVVRRRVAREVLRQLARV